MLVFRIDGQFTDPNLETLERDRLLSGDNGGVRYLFDTAFPFSYVSGAPSNGIAVNDIAEIGNGSFVLRSGETVAFNGNGFDFSAMTATSGKSDAHVIAPASVWANIYPAQHFLLCMYMRLPTDVDWNTDSSILPFFASSSNATGYSAVPDPITPVFHATSKSIRFRRQTAINAQTETIVIPTGNYGQVAQVAYWRTAAGVGARVKGPGGTTSVSVAVGVDNSADFSACQPRFGSVTPFSNYALAGHQTGRKYRLYRGFIENLETSGRDATAVLDADYQRVIDRAVFS